MCGTPSNLTLTDTSSSECACCAPQDNKTKSVPAAGSLSASFGVTGLTCGSCASRVSSAVGEIDDVTDVQIDLVSGGTSTVTVLSNQAVPAAAVRSAVEQAGYQLSNA
ncbi:MULTISPECIES: heavy-metal-associated domain-containing protein [unclassified Arthrobacter]|uniref:heavy-metal-associated domain-containing protein n=1 Tax=unclassified Arthrobacter TaxID=235627 RepID=UPI00149158D7|nr:MULTISPECIES: heavy metal-associated domain-containing protein [unclassified Arthrobacter]MBE0010240.1 heavy-metal-associated domain-containing protein [Arthrobacter sp. AET 35A]NOJ64118.1 heavy-metal-associated domain-containing protein [Arthrobacter sp. 147(2020)]